MEKCKPVGDDNFASTSIYKEKNNIMDFFDYQEQARKKTGLLVFYYIIAVALIVVSIYTVIAFLFGMSGPDDEPVPVSTILINPELFLWVALGTLLIVGLGTMYKISQLGGGGASVAKMLGGRLINHNSTDADERRVLNVVEEMAIASGMPVPPVYMMDNEQSINAFAAGLTPGNAVVGVTRGCVQQLSRDELQGVIAHEFSHIFNGDMRLNIHLLGVLNGILVIALIGYFIMRGSMFGRVSSRNSKDNGGAVVIILGIALMIIGYVGVFFAKLIKSAVSRQREFLADASAVQFTRNPSGLAGALGKIGGYSSGSKIQSPHAEEASHMFFSNGLKSSFLNMMSTHPSLEERIGRIDESFMDTHEKSASNVDAGAKASTPPPPLPELVSGFSAEPEQVVASVGAPSLDHLHYASVLMSNIPDALNVAVRNTVGARAIVYLLLINDNKTVSSEQLIQISKSADSEVNEMVLKNQKLVAGLSRELRLPLVDLSISTLKELTQSEFLVFRDIVTALIAADKQVDLFEFTLQRMILRHLEPEFVSLPKKKIKFTSVKSIMPICGQLLSCLAYWGADDVESAKDAFATAMARLGGDLNILNVDGCGLSMLDHTLSQLELAMPALKRKVIEACTSCIAADGRVTVEEADLLRAVADSLDCPIPPFLPGKIG
jgi:Zn-dependent protease with chaperone function